MQSSKNTICFEVAADIAINQLDLIAGLIQETVRAQKEMDAQDEALIGTDTGHNQYIYNDGVLDLRFGTKHVHVKLPRTRRRARILSRLMEQLIDVYDEVLTYAQDMRQGIVL